MPARGWGMGKVLWGGVHEKPLPLLDPTLSASMNFDSPMVALNLLALNRQECSVADALTMEGTCIGRAPMLVKGSMRENHPKGVHGHEVP